MGRLVLVSGPSGAGKDTLIAGAMRALAGDSRFVFPRRVVTRHAMAELEDHDSLDRPSFIAHRAAGGFALDWAAHGLLYGIPAAIDADLAAGRIVVANVSRSIILSALSNYPEAVVLLVTADPERRAERLAARGRESAADIAARLRREGAVLPAAITQIVIDNSGTPADGVAAFVAALRNLASTND